MSVVFGKGEKKMTHMDAYTILYQANEYMTEDKMIENIQSKVCGDEQEVVRSIALDSIEKGIHLIRFEYPPNVSKRIDQYYRQNKEVLVDTFSNKVKEVLYSSKEQPK